MVKILSLFIFLIIIYSIHTKSDHNIHNVSNSSSVALRTGVLKGKVYINEVKLLKNVIRYIFIGKC